MIYEINHILSAVIGWVIVVAGFILIAYGFSLAIKTLNRIRNKGKITFNDWYGSKR